MAYLDKRDEELLVKLKLFVNKKPSGDQRLVAILDFLKQFFKQDDFNGCWCLRTLAEVPRTNKRVRSKIKTNKNGLLAFIGEVVEENKPDLDHAQINKLARSISLLYEASVSESHLQNEPWPIDESIEILSLLLKSKMFV